MGFLDYISTVKPAAFARVFGRTLNNMSPGLSVYRGLPGRGNFTLEVTPDPPATKYSTHGEFPQGAIFETSRSYMTTYEDELFIAMEQMPAADFR